MYSALKHGGVPLYELARRGVEVERRARDIEIARLSLVLGGPERIDFAIECSKGTYIRVLAAEIGEALGTVAHLARLRRTRVGIFHVEDATSLAMLVAAHERTPLPVLPLRTALANYATFTTDAENLHRLRQGQQQSLARLPVPRVAGETALVLDGKGEVAAVIEAGGARPAWRLARVLGEMDRGG
jgi:tRNA pseudouridine55 synthase